MGRSQEHKAAYPGTFSGPYFMDPPEDQADAEGAVSYDIGALVAELGGNVVYSASGLPTGVTIHATTGVASGTASAGTYDCVVTVKNGDGGDTRRFQWVVS